MESGFKIVFAAFALCVTVSLLCWLLMRLLSRAVDRYGIRPSLLSGMMKLCGGLYLLTFAFSLPPRLAALATAFHVAGSVVIAFGLEQMRVRPQTERRPLWYRGQGDLDWNPDPSPHRFWPQVSLAWMMTATLCLALSFAVSGRQIEAARLAQRKHAAAVTRIRALGGTVQQGMVSLAGTAVEDEDLACLLDLNRIYDLNLGSTAITNRGLKSVAEIDQLRRLTLSGTEIDDDGLRTLVTLRRLVDLSVRQTRVTGTAFPLFASTQLVSLDVSRCPISKDGLECIRQTSCQHLSLNETRIDDSMLAVLNAMDLQTLTLIQTDVSESGYDEIRANRPSMRVYWSPR